MWPRSPADEKARLEADIGKERGKQLAAQHRLEDAVTTECRSMAMVEASRALQTLCRREVTEHADAICSLQDELAALPLQRDPDD